MDKYRSAPPPEILGKTRQRRASLDPQALTTVLGVIPEWTLPWEGSLGSPTWRIWLQSVPLWGEVRVEGGKAGAEGPEGPGLSRKGLRALRLEEARKRSYRDGFKPTVPWSLPAMRYQAPPPKKMFIFGRVA